MIIELSVFSNNYINKLRQKEDALNGAEQKLSFIRAKIKLIQEALPKLTDNSVWYSAYTELEQLQLSEFQANDEKNRIWTEIKTFLTEVEQAPDAKVIQIIR